MAKFSDGVKRFSSAVDVKNQAIFAGVAAETKNSIQFGSPLTGAPGQPVENEGPDKGNLRASWTEEFTSPTSALIATNCEYAESNEDGIARPGGGAYVLRANVGGRHSVKLTVTNMDKIVDAETKRLDGTVSRSMGPNQ